MPPKKSPQPSGPTANLQKPDVQGNEHKNDTTNNDPKSLSKVEKLDKEPRKTAKENHLISPNSKSQARVDKLDERQSRTRQTILAKQRGKSAAPSIYDVPDSSSQSPPDPFEPEVIQNHQGANEPTSEEPQGDAKATESTNEPTSNGPQSDAKTTETHEDTKNTEGACEQLGDLQLPDIIQHVQQGQDHKAEAQDTKQGNDPDPSRQLLFTPNKDQEGRNTHEGSQRGTIQDDHEKQRPHLESQVHLNQEANKTTQSVTLPLPLSNSIDFTSPSEYVKYVEGPKSDKGPPIQTFTYLYSSSVGQSTGMKVLVNSYSKLLPLPALQTLWTIEPWNLHIGGDELLHAFQVPALNGDDLSQFHYAPYMARPHKNLVSLLKTHHTFFLQPPRFNQVPHGWGEDVLTETSWVEDIVKAIEEVVKTSHIKPRGWIVFESNDPNIKARDLLGSQNHVKFRILRKHVATIQMFTRVAPQVPRWKDTKVTTASMLVQSTPFIAILLKPFANEAGTTLPIAPCDHALTAGLPRKRFLESMEMDASMPETHLRMDIHPKLMSQEHRLTTRDFYLFVNTYFAPNGPNVEWNTNNAVYPFDNALITVFPQKNPRASPQNDGYIRCDYKLPTVIAELLMRTILSSQLFLTGRVFAINMDEFSNSNSYFVQPTRDLIGTHPGQCNPIEIFSAVRGHVPGGSQNIKILGSALRTGSSVVFLLDLTSLPAATGLTQEQTLSRHLFFQVGLLLYRTANATLVRHTQRAPAWSLIPAKPVSILKEPVKEANSPLLVYLQCPDSMSTRDLKITAALIGKFEKFGRHSSLGQCASLYSVTYSHTDSVALAHKLAIDEVVFIPNVDLPQRKQEILLMDNEVNEMDRELVATINAGVKLGSRNAIMELQELERRILDVVDKMSVTDWHVEPPPLEYMADLEESKAPEPQIVATDNRTLRAKCRRIDDERYMMSPSKYKPSAKAIALESDMENMIHVEAPEGLTIVWDFITEQEEQMLIDWANTFQWDNDVPTRETAQFGYKFNYTTHDLEKGRPWTKELEALAEKLKPYMKGKPINQCIANRTNPPQGFGRHFDDSKFDDPVCILGTAAAVNFILLHRDGRRFHATRSLRRCLIVLSGEARYTYAHAIPEGVDDAWYGKLYPRGTRISWTFRSVMDVSMFDE